MKKEIIIIISIILGITVLHIVSQNYTNNFFDEFSEELGKLEDKIIEKSGNEDYNKDEIEKNIDELHEKWQSKYNLFACIIEHDELEKIRVQIVSIGANIKVNNYGKSVDEIEKCRFFLKHIEEKDSLKIVNVF